MIYTIVSVRDRAAEAFSPPINTPSRGVAIRSFQDEINRASPDNQYYQHPDDYDLYLLGTFDDNSGQYTLLAIPEIIMTGATAKITSN